jgi:GxxExxY protein
MPNGERENPQITQITQIPDKDDPRTHAIIGAALEVHRRLGCGFLEAVYQEAMAIEMTLRGVPFEREVELPVSYRGQKLAVTYRADFICFGSVVVELKALGRLSGTEEWQLINYLKASEHEVGLMLNFGTRSLEQRRVVCSRRLHSAESAKSADWKRK